ncbi:MAG TPA: TetR/AcrR family transcriptional regulator, partial [Erythrobacter sp.]|nr:TetR/AcrR family transcriptional regulator [Erythrobacter sp.]
STAALTAVSLKAGGIVASRRAPFATVEAICLHIVMAGTESDERIASGKAG